MCVRKRDQDDLDCSAWSTFLVRQSRVMDLGLYVSWRLWGPRVGDGVHTRVGGTMRGMERDATQGGNLVAILVCVCLVGDDLQPHEGKKCVWGVMFWGV